jgi:formiminotetrahydrofolate cyclodeaminase
MTEDPIVSTSGSSVEDWTSALGERIGAPGGGAAAGVMLAIAAALCSMVAGYTDDGAAAEVPALRDRATARRRRALRMADEDAIASKEFGAAFTLEPGPERDEAVRASSFAAARASAALGELAMELVDDLEWLSTHGNRALVADVAVALGAVRGALSAARSNVSFDLAAPAKAGSPLEQVRDEEPEAWAAVRRIDAAVARVDRIAKEIDPRAAPTAASGL